MIERAAQVADPAAPAPESPLVAPAPERGPAPSAPTTARLLVQAKLTVGAADDPFERDADRVAGQVVRAIRRQPAPPAPSTHEHADHGDHDHGHGDHAHGTCGSGCGHASHQRLRIDRHVADARCGGGQCGHPEHRQLPVQRIQRVAHVGLDGGEVDTPTERVMRSAMRGGRPLPDPARSTMESAFGADFSGVRVHTGPQATDLSDRIQATAFTTGSHVFFRDGLPDVATTGGQTLLAHELTHTIQQGGAVARMIAPSTRRETLIQRHASWEHKMLGDVDPETLEIIAAGRDVAAEQAKRNSFFTKTQKSAKTISTEAGVQIDLETVLHTIDQEISRLRYFQTSPPTGTVAEATAALEKLDADRRKGELADDLGEDARAAAEQEIDDATWGVRLVSIPLNDGTSFLVTYGEMNTLADFYGSAADMAVVPAANFRGIVGGVREESIRKFMRLRNELTTGDKVYQPDSHDHDIAGAIGNKGTLNGAHVMSAALNADQFGELKLMGKVGDEERLGIPGRDDTSYTAGLARNACHFAPHSWHAWATAHQKAIALAAESWTARDKAIKLEAQTQALADRTPARQGDQQAIAHNRRAKETLDATAEQKLNAALIENGFGDHFLQDSYAAGHLIDKTLIMQWFATWLDTQGNKRDYSTADEWRRVQQIAYGQKGVAGTALADPSTIGTTASNDPQSVENLDGDWTKRFDALGLQIPSVLRDPTSAEFDVFTWWQGETMNGRLLTTDYKVLLEKSPVKNKAQLQAALKRLIDDGVVYYDWYSTKDRAKGADQIGLETLGVAKDLKIKKEYIPDKAKEASFLSAVAAAKTGDTGAYDKMSKAVTYGDYHTFLNHGYLQLASNVLHDHFCKNGLDVATAEGSAPYRIYGDNAMLGKESSKMVKYSAETAHRSRDSIYDLATTGRTDMSTESIAARFPTWVRLAGSSKNISLAEWHGEGGSLHKFCFSTVFPDTAGVFSKSSVAASGALVGQVSKDATVAVHSGEAF